jgi:DNA invertase Pin-like site-specific DNA recombinase
MRTNDLPASVTSRAAAVYVRQSTPGQVHDNLESQRRQYALADLARTYGFRDVHVIDGDLGRSGSGSVERPGFEHLVTLVCSGTIGAVFALEASRLARNGRDWHRLVDLCGIVDTRVIDADGVYDPRRPNDRLLLGLKGTMSEFELTLLHSRLAEAKTAKAKRGEFRLRVPVGYVWPLGGQVELDPDERVQSLIRLVFQKFDELGSGHKVLFWMRKNGIEFYGQTRAGVSRDKSACVWRPTTYRQILGILTNPFYAGVYAFGKHETKVSVTDGRARKTLKNRPSEADWTVRIPLHHPGYIDEAQYERNRQRLGQNHFAKSTADAKAARGGRALLAGLLRCARCGQRLAVAYSGRSAKNPRYACNLGHRNRGLPHCIGFGALRTDKAVAEQVLAVVEPHAIAAATMAAKLVQNQRDLAVHARRQALEQAEYEAKLAARRYEAVDPDNRLVARQLELRWNEALARVEFLGIELRRQDAEIPVTFVPPERLDALAHDLHAVWHSEDADMHTKQRIVRTLIAEIVADVDDAAGEAVLTIHWRGGRHSSIRARLPKTGEHGRQHAPDSIKLVESMAGTWSDEHIAATLNRLGHQTGHGLSWTASRVGALRKTHGIAAYASREGGGTWLTMYESAQALGVTSHVIRRMIRRGKLAATQVMPAAPWQIRATDLQAPAVAEFLVSRRTLAPCRPNADPRQPMIPGI